MMKKSWQLAIAFITICIFTWATISYASSESSSGTNYTIATPYQYHVKSGTDEWRALTNHAEKVELFQIPEDILPLMTTEALAKTVLEYPLMVDMLAWDSTTVGYKVIAATFNGLAELERRSDGLSTRTELSQDTVRTTDNMLSEFYLNIIIHEMSDPHGKKIEDRAATTTVFTSRSSSVDD